MKDDDVSLTSAKSGKLWWKARSVNASGFESAMFLLLVSCEVRLVDVWSVREALLT